MNHLDKPMKKIRKYIFVIFLLLFMLLGCVNPKTTKSKTEDNYLMPLNDAYAYLRVEVLSKDVEKRTMNVKVLDFGSYSNVNIGTIAVGTEGIVDCSELFTMAGIKEKVDWIISYKADNQTDFPIIVYSIENTEDFDERTKEAKIVSE